MNIIYNCKTLWPEFFYLTHATEGRRERCVLFVQKPRSHYYYFYRTYTAEDALTFRRQKSLGIPKRDVDIVHDRIVVIYAAMATRFNR